MLYIRNASLTSESVDVKLCGSRYRFVQLLSDGVRVATSAEWLCHNHQGNFSLNTVAPAQSVRVFP